MRFSRSTTISSSSRQAASSFIASPPLLIRGLSGHSGGELASSSLKSSHSMSIFSSSSSSSPPAAARNHGGGEPPRPSWWGNADGRSCPPALWRVGKVKSSIVFLANLQIFKVYICVVLMYVYYSSLALLYLYICVYVYMWNTWCVLLASSSSYGMRVVMDASLSWMVQHPHLPTWNWIVCWRYGFLEFQLWRHGWQGNNCLVISAHCWAKMTGTEGLDASNDHMLCRGSMHSKVQGGRRCVCVCVVECTLKNVHGSGLPNRSCE